jgi:hypothetical protein
MLIGAVQPPGAEDGKKAASPLQNAGSLTDAGSPVDAQHLELLFAEQQRCVETVSRIVQQRPLAAALWALRHGQEDRAATHHGLSAASLPFLLLKCTFFNHPCKKCPLPARSFAPYQVSELLLQSPRFQAHRTVLQGAGVAVETWFSHSRTGIEQLPPKLLSAPNACSHCGLALIMCACRSALTARVLSCSLALARAASLHRYVGMRPYHTPCLCEAGTHIYTASCIASHLHSTTPPLLQKITQTLVSTGTKAVFLNPTDALHGDIGIVGEHDLLVCFSKSGNTEELLKLVPYAKVWHTFSSFTCFPFSFFLFCLGGGGREGKRHRAAAKASQHARPNSKLKPQPQHRRYPAPHTAASLLHPTPPLPFPPLLCRPRAPAWSASPPARAQSWTSPATWQSTCPSSASCAPST